MGAEFFTTGYETSADGRRATLIMNIPGEEPQSGIIEIRGVRQSMPYPQDVEDMALFTAHKRAEELGVELGMTDVQRERLGMLQQIPDLEPLPFPA